MAEKDLKHMLQHTLRSPALRKQAERLSVNEHLEMIHDPLWEINAVFLDVQLRALKDPKLKEMADAITKAIADVHHLLGRILDWQPKPPTPAAVAAAAAAAAAGAAFNFSPLPLPCCPEVPDAFRHALLLQMNEMASTLSLLVSRGTSMGLQKEMMESMDPRQQEFGDILRKEAVEREDEKNAIIKLLQERQSNEDIPLMLAISGPDGRGKTTLARMIFHDTNWVRKHFDTRIWVDSPNCFSFDPISIARDFTECIAKEPLSYLHHLQTLWLRINKVLVGSRYLLVIDDVAMRKEDYDKWEQLKHVFLRVGLPGSRVIAVTSSSDDSIPRTFDRKHYIQGLPRNDWLQLFSSHAGILADEAKEIYFPDSFLSEKDNSPLLAKLLGLWVRYAEPRPSQDQKHYLQGLPRNDWLQLFSSHAGILADEAKEIYFPDSFLREEDNSPFLAKLLGLWVRYAEPRPSQEGLNVNHDDQYLPLLFQFLLPRNEQLRIYDSLFPQDNTRDLEDLLQMLTAVGLVPHPEQKAAAAYYLQLFLEYQKEEFTITKLCRSSVKTEGNVRSSRLQQWPHMALSVDQSTRKLPKVQSSKLRTLILARDKKMVLANQKCQIDEIPDDIFKSLGDLRVLDLRATMIRELPATVCEMLNLRYLNLSWSDLKMLPESFCDLRNLLTLKLDHCERLHQLPEEIHKLGKLQVLKLAYCTKLEMLPKSVTGLLHLEELDIEGCEGLVELPEDLKNLKRLRYLNMMRCAKLSRMPRGIRRLTELRTLLGYVAVDEPGSCTIPKLRHLENLEELHLEHLERVSNPRDAESMKLEDKRYLQRLQLIWNIAEVNGKTAQGKHENLEDKTAQRSAEQEEPALPKVQQKVPEKLKVNTAPRKAKQEEEAALRKVQKEVLENLKVNTALRKLEIVSYQSEELPKWMKVGQPYHFTLVEIKLVNLKRCKVLPPLGRLPRLRIVEISGMERIDVVGQEFYDTRGTFPSLIKLTFSEMPCLKKWERKKGDIPRGKQLFPCLTELTLIQCPELKEIEVVLPAIKRLKLWLNNEKLLTQETADKFSSLTELEVVGWKHLPDELHLFKNITNLTLVRCQESPSLPNWLKGFVGLRILKITSIPKGLCEALPDLDIQINGRPEQTL